VSKMQRRIVDFERVSDIRQALRFSGVGMSLQDVEVELEHERQHRNRPEVIALLNELSQRIIAKRQQKLNL